MRVGSQIKVGSPIRILMKSNKLEGNSFSIKRMRIDTKSPSIFQNKSIEDRLDKSPLGLISRLKPLIDIDSKQKKDIIKPQQLKGKEKLCLDVVKALFDVTNCSDEIPASSIIELFLGLGYSSDYESLRIVLKAVSPNPFLSSFSRADIKSFLKDQKLSNSLKVVLKELKDSPLAYMPQEFDTFILILKKWWAKLDSSKTSFVSSEEVLKFLISIDLFESSSDLNKTFSKFSQYMSFPQFLAIFSKGLFKFLLIQLCTDSNKSLLPLDITLNAKKRKIFLKGLKGESKVIEALTSLNKYK